MDTLNAYIEELLEEAQYHLERAVDREFKSGDVKANTIMNLIDRIESFEATAQEIEELYNRVCVLEGRLLHDIKTHKEAPPK